MASPNQEDATSSRPLDKRAYISVEKLRRIAEQSNATVVFGHDPEQRKQLTLAPNGFYS